MIELLQDEIVKEIEFSNGKYLISSYGRVFRTPTTMRPWYAVLSGEINHGYNRVNLFINGKAKKYRVHRLVADAFINNPLNKPHVNHLDGNKLNNNFKNLEWCTSSENQLHSYRVLGKTKWNARPEHVRLKVVKLKKSGVKRKDICSLLNVSKSFVDKILQYT